MVRLNSSAGNAFFYIQNGAISRQSVSDLKTAQKSLTHSEPLDFIVVKQQVAFHSPGGEWHLRGGERQWTHTQ